MAIRKVARMGHPVLREHARELTQAEIRSPEIRRLIEDMIETMEEYGGIGLAAPQVHEPIRLAIIGYSDDNCRYPGQEETPLGVYINPKVTFLTEDKQSFWEGCLSVPGMRGLVSRPKKVRVDYLTHEGKLAHITAEGFLATVFQHELDHLDGVIYIDRVEHSPGQNRLSFNEEYERYLVPEEGDEVGELED